MSEKYLQHFGILGMKWGVRHEVGPDGRIIGSKFSSKEELVRRNANKLEKAAFKSDAKFRRVLHNMSTEELLDVIARLQIEQSYRNLANVSLDTILSKEKLVAQERKDKQVKEAAKPKKSNAPSMISDIFSKSFSNIGTQLTTAGLGSLVNALFGKTVSSSDLSSLSNEELSSLINRMQNIDKLSEYEKSGKSSSYKTEIVNPKKGQKDK